MAKHNFPTNSQITNFRVNGLQGRMLRMAAPKGKKREILFVYGQHSSIERWWGLAQVLNQFGALTMPDLPGFGGMDSLYQTGKRASIDNLADYFADYIRAHHANKKITIAAMSLGFVITTRMLQRHPELIKHVDLLVSIVGFGDYTDFTFAPVQRRRYIVLSTLLSTRLGSLFVQHVALQPALLRPVYSHMRLAKEKFKDKVGDDFKAIMDAEVNLWTINDIRTQMQTNREMLTLHSGGPRIHLPVLHVASHKDRYFNHDSVARHLAEVYDSVSTFYTTDPNHAPTIIADLEAAAPFIPAALCTILDKSPAA